MTRLLAVFLCLVLIAPPIFAGAFLDTLNFGQQANTINHPVLYVGNGGVRTIRVCLDPDTLDIDQREPSIERAIATWNAMVPEMTNLELESIPESDVDFETTMLHELGHCLFGLAHPNIGTPTDAFLGQATKANPGGNGVFDVGVGSDGVPGTTDDLRGDDVARHWFFEADNYPFLLTTPVDSTTYSRSLGDLPPGSTFAANANRLSGPASMPPVSNTEAVMNAYTFTGEANRRLQHDDVATFLFAASGLDETEGTSDDYTADVVYQGRTTSNCDVVIDNITGSPPPGIIARCDVDGILIGGAEPHFRIAGIARLEISNDVSWYYPEIFVDGFESGDTSRWDAEIEP